MAPTPPRPLTLASLAAASAVAFAVACSPRPPVDTQPSPTTPTAAAATPSATPAASTATMTKGACADAALSLAADEVIAVVGEASIKASDLGPELASAEGEALRDYCQRVAAVRQQAVDQAIDRHLLEKAAAAASMELEAFLEAKAKANTRDPSDDEALAFYDKHKSPSAPPFEMVKDQVIAAMVEEQTGERMGALVRDLRAATAIELRLPDVRPPAFDLGNREAHPSLGDPEALVEVTEFSDFECPYCSMAAETLLALKERYPAKVRFTFRHFPLSFHPNARPAAEYSHCAHEQGKFWPFHDLIFANQRELAGDTLGRLAGEAGLDPAKLQSCLDSGRARDHVSAELATGETVGVGGTPSFFINGRAFAGNPTVDGLAAAIDAELAAGS